MAYNEELAERIRQKLSVFDNVEEKKMMGGLVFMLNDKMCMGIMKDDLMCRIDKELQDTYVEQPGCRSMEFSNKPLSGYILIDETGLTSSLDFNYWINLALEFNKKAKSSKKKKATR